MAFQEKIWSYFQGEGVQRFAGAVPRLDYLFRQVKRRASGAPSVLNIGIGNGYLESRCQQAGFRTCAIDPVPACVESLRSKGIDAKTAFVSAIPFPENHFDFVVASEVLEHLDDQELQAGVANIARVLRPGGHFLGTVPYREDLRDHNVMCPDCGKIFHPWGHLQSFDFQALQAALAPSLSPVRMSVRNFPATTSLRSRVSAMARQALLALGSHSVNESLVFVFSKPGKS